VSQSKAVTEIRANSKEELVRELKLVAEMYIDALVAGLDDINYLGQRVEMHNVWMSTMNAKQPYSFSLVAVLVDNLSPEQREEYDGD